MPPKAADKKPASKAPATASKAPEKKDAGKKTAATGEKKKRTKARKETYSSYIYKGKSTSALLTHDTRDIFLRGRVFFAPCLHVIHSSHASRISNRITIC
jgi:hypothetical protein